VIARLAGLAIDARFATGMPQPWDAVARARAARWVAANALAVRGVQVALIGVAPDEPRLFGLRADRLVALLAAAAALPLLVDDQALPCHWRLALHALGFPALDRPAAAALAAGASVLSLSAGEPGACEPRRYEIAVDRESRQFRVRVGAPERMLAA
jgi:hypothetical protein